MLSKWIYLWFMCGFSDTWTVQWPSLTLGVFFCTLGKAVELSLTSGCTWLQDRSCLDSQCRVSTGEREVPGLESPPSRLLAFLGQGDG